MHALIKLNAGLTVLVVGAIVALCARPARRWRDVALFAASYAGALLCFWLLVAGQPLGALPDYLRHSAEIVSGYAEYAYTEEGGREWEYLALPVVVGVVGWTLWEATSGWSLQRRAGAAALCALVAFSLFKQGFVRHDGHSLAFFASMLGMAIALGWARHRAAGLLPAALLALVFLAALRPVPATFVNPTGTLSLIRDHVRILRDPGPWIAEQREILRRAEAIDPATLALVGDAGFHAFPSEAAVAWAYPQLTWKPLPVVQGFVAYTPALSGLNADTVRAADGPERLLRTTEYSPFEDPETTLEVFCRFEQLRATEKWQVLARTSDRCGSPRVLARVETATEAAVDVPRPGRGELVAVRIAGFDTAGLERVRSLLYKPYDHVVVYDDGSGARIAPSLASAPHLLRVDPGVDYGPGWRMGLDVRTLTFRIGKGGIVGSPSYVARPITVEFLAIPVARPGVR
jgi:hypothetical protein